MTQELAIPTDHLKKDLETGLTLPLPTQLGSQELSEHHALIIVEMEILAKKFDRYKWNEERGTHVQDQMILDFVKALEDYPIDEIREACRACVLNNPKKMPNEGHIRQQVIKARALKVSAYKAKKPTVQESSAPRVTAERAAQIMKDAGIENLSPKPKKFGGKIKSIAGVER